MLTFLTVIKHVHGAARVVSLTFTTLPKCSEGKNQKGMQIWVGRGCKDAGGRGETNSNKEEVSPVLGRTWFRVGMGGR